jgi:hypothetical protein
MNRITRGDILSTIVFVALSMAARAQQFKEIPPAPYTPALARQKIRTLLENGDPGNRQQTAETLSGLLVWYRDIVDDELIAAWQGDARANLPALMPLLADSRVASAIVELSWRQQRPIAFNLTYAPMLEDLMARYPESADPFLRDLLGSVAAGGPMPALSQPEADAVCRILLDMPDTGNWKTAAAQILPHYLRTAQNLLLQDLHGNDREKSYRAQIWLAELKLNVPDSTSDRPMQSRTLMRSPSPVYPSYSGPPYSGPRSGTLTCTGAPVPPNGEYVFPGMPLGNLRIDLDGKPWDARLVRQGQTQDLILRNASSAPQKRCTVRWSIVP